MKTLLGIILFNCIYFVAIAQNSDNIVPNPSFESYANFPLGWFYKGEHFNYVMKYWTSPTTASPDIFGPKTRVPSNWAEKGFGEQIPHGGGSMVGITTYGCINGKPHCREYIQILLAEPLVAGQTYLVEFWLAHLSKSLQINRIGAFFSPKKIDEKTEKPLELKPQVQSEAILSAPNGTWTKFSERFVALEEADYLIIGNFFSDDNTKVKDINDPKLLNFAYYYIDDVLVKKIPPFVDVPIKSDDLTRIKMEKGKTIRLKDIYFETDKADLLPRSYIELRKLLKVMRENPNLIIEIDGHTDNVGSYDYNIALSINRAKAVIDFLIYNGIPRQRANFKGFGEVKPIATNDTEDGRQLNRRVELKIIAL